MNNAQMGQVVNLGEGGYLPWQHVSRGLRVSVSLLHGCAGTLLAATLAWDHKSATLALVFAWLACTTASLTTAGLMHRLRPPVSLLVGLATATALCVALVVPTRAGTGWMAAIIVSALLASGLNMTYMFEGDAVHAGARNLRWITGIAAFGAVFYALVQARDPAARNAGAVGFTFIFTMGLVIAQMMIIRRAQAEATKLSQRAILYAPLGLAELPRALKHLRPIVRYLLTGLAIALGMLGLASLLMHFVSRLHLAGRSSQVTPKPPLHSHLPQRLPPVHAWAGGTSWLLWSAVAICVAIAILWLLRQQRRLASDVNEPTAVAITIVRRSASEAFRLQATGDPTRKAYQARLRTWHAHGHTIGRADTPRAFAMRLPTDEQQTTDADLLQRYERVRYGRPGEP
ncbi:hypothetical protein SD51_00450 [Alicyclobacillus tengchongensis]|nr:hypothetical protein SD51_00450 [Alicyclobacillus tengchongensis]